MRRALGRALVCGLLAVGLGAPAAAQGEPQGEEWDDAWGEDPVAADRAATHEAAHDHAAHDHAAHGEAHHFDALQFAAQAVNFVLWLAIVIYLARKPVTAFLEGRRRSVEEGLVEARTLKEAAEAKYADYSERLEHLDEELAKLRKEMVQASETERDRIIDEAESRAARMRADTRFVIEQQLKQLRTDLTREAIEAAIAAAERVLAEEVREPDLTRLADQYLDGIEGTMKDGGVRA
ncbi:MAG: ATP synthase F0 subunit B [Sandaracinaceae bacterium]|nr:ATP synthase F0 subunit B [Sandaracinaceae bacterium]